jgi:NAD(P)-dependent dehydrogenase (short-subunit alcohol dehydrogenase family)
MAAPDYALRDKVVLVTGAASGIGRATAELFARQGARVVASDLDAEAGAEAVQGLRAAGASALFHAADVRDDEALAALVARAVEEHGRLDCAANCAGVGAGHGATHSYDHETWNRIVDINLRGTWQAMRHEIDAMLKGGNGGPSSTSRPRSACAGRSSARPTPRASTACSADADGGHRVRDPGNPGQRRLPGRDRHAHDGRDLRPLPRLPGDAHRLCADAAHGRPDEVAHAIAWLSCEGSSFLTGEALPIEGGLLAR